MIYTRTFNSGTFNNYIIRFYFTDEDHNLVHTATNNVSPPIEYINTTQDPDIIPITTTNREGFAFDWRPPYTTENSFDSYTLGCNKHLSEPDHEIVINVTSLTDNCLTDPVSNIDHTIYVGPFFFSSEGNPQTDPQVPNLNVVKGITFVQEGDSVRYIFNDNSHTAKHVAYNNLVDPGTDLASPEFNFVPTNNGDYFDWTAVRQSGDDITQMFVVCQPHRTIFGQGHRSELIVLPADNQTKPYDSLMAVGSVAYPDYTGTKYPYFQNVELGLTQIVPTSGLTTTSTTINVGQTMRWLFIEANHNVVEVNSDGTPHASPAFSSTTSTNNLDYFDWTPTSGDIGDHYITSTTTLGSGYTNHVVHKLIVN